MIKDLITFRTNLTKLHGAIALSAAICLSACDNSPEESAPQSAEYHIIRGESLFEQKQFGASLKEVESALSTDAEFAPAWHLQGQNFLELGDVKRAEEAFIKAIAKDANQPEYQWDFVRTQLGQNKFENANLALDTLQRADDNIKTNSTFLALRGDAQLGLNQLIEAKANYNKALELEPNMVTALLGLAKAGYKEGNLEQLTHYTDLAEKADPQNIEVLLWQAQTSLDAQKFEQAESFFSQILIQLSEIDVMTAKKFFALNGMIKALIGQGKTEQALSYSDIIKQSPQGKLINDYKYAFGTYNEGDMNNAEKAFTDILDTIPGHAPASAAMGAIKFTQGDYQVAESHLLGVVQQSDELVKAHKLLALTQLKLDKPNDVIKLVGRALVESPNDAELLSLMGITYIDLEDFKEAEHYLKRAEKADAKHLATRLALGNLRHRAGDTKQAIKYFEGVIKDRPDNPLGYRHLLAAKADQDGQAAAVKRLADLAQHYANEAAPQKVLIHAYSHTGDFDKAIATANASLKQFPTDDSLKEIKAAALFKQAQAQMLAKRFDAARETLTQSQTLAPNNMAIPALSIQIELAANNAKGALKQAEALKKTYPNNPMGFEISANIQGALGNRFDAVQDFEKAWQLTQTPALGTKLFNAKLAGGTPPAQALTHLKQWSEQNADNQAALFTYAMANQSAGLRDEAIALYERLVIEQPNNGVVLNNLAWLRYEKGDANALELAKRAFTAEPKNASIVDTYGWILFKDGQLEQALDYLRKAHSLAPDQVDIMQHLVEVLKANDLSDEADEMQVKINNAKTNAG